MVTEEVARDPDLVHPDPVHVLEDGLERGKVCVDVAKEGESHRREPHDGPPISRSARWIEVSLNRGRGCRPDVR